MATATNLSPLFVELLNRKYQWIHNGVIPRNVLPDELYHLFKLQGACFSFSFPSRGLPTNLSENTEGEYRASQPRAYYPSYLTRKDLIKKVGEMMILPDKDAARSYVALSKIVQQLPKHEGNPDHQRIVFWYLT